MVNRMSEPIRALLVFGTRPEAIKMAPVYHKLKTICHVAVCLTAQHRAMLDQVMRIFSIEAEYDLNIMTANQSLTQITTRVLAGLEMCLSKFKPDFVFVHGDTTTTMAAALAAFYKRIPVCHVEAGLRTGDVNNPYPEELNRKLTSSIATYHFSPTQKSRNNLISEGVSSDRIFVTGNTAIDALHMAIRELSKSSKLSAFNPEAKKKILVTAHRRENFGKGMRDICFALECIAKKRNDINIVFPVHFNPNVRTIVNQMLGELKNVTLIDPVGYLKFVRLMQDADLIITDSGGVQEEAPSLGKPVLVMRKCTERPEAVLANTVLLVGTDPVRIANEALDLLGDEERYLTMARSINPYGDGYASERIASYFEYIVGTRDSIAMIDEFRGIS
jgi:UDP-N-acetylglucosamine 2-epimerase (non-hydrolysing)